MKHDQANQAVNPRVRQRRFLSTREKLPDRRRRASRLAGPCRRWRSAMVSTPICCSPGGVSREEPTPSVGQEPIELLPVTQIADAGSSGFSSCSGEPSAPDGDRAHWRRARIVVGARMRTHRRSRAWPARCRGDDPATGGRAGVAGDRPHRHAQGI